MVGDVIKLRQTRRVLLVMSNAVQAALVLSMLSSESLITETLVVNEFYEGLASFEGNPDFVLLDVSTLDESGTKLVADIHSSFPNYVLIALNGSTDRTVALNMISAGADDYLALAAYDAPMLCTAILFALERKLRSNQEQKLPLADPKGVGHRRRALSHPYVDIANKKAFSAVSLQDAVYRDELVLHYQPIVDLRLGKVSGVEALVRWQHPTDGLIGPDLFIPVAEISGLIIELGTWVMEKACQQAVIWAGQGLDLDMAVNVSTRQIAHPDLIETVSRVMNETGIDPRKLILEVTESAIMEDAEQAAVILAQIASFGISLAIDDFGTGYSSLVYLKRYPIRALKIEKSFIAGMGLFAEDDAIVASIIELANAVGGSCIAEGVETAAQQEALYDLGCQSAQGWLFGKAVPPEDIPQMIANCEEDLSIRIPNMPRPGTRRDVLANKRDLLADRRDTAADKRDSLADGRDSEGDHRDSLADERDTAADGRDTAADGRETAADGRDTAADGRETAADGRETAADGRDSEGDHRDSLADERDTAADGRDSAHSDRGIGATQRNQAELERDSAHSDRGIGATQRNQAELERDSAQNDRGVGATQRNQAELERDSAQNDRGLEATKRNQAELERDSAQNDRD